MRITMLRTHRFTVPNTSRLQTVKYMEGSRYTVKRAWGLEMVGLGAAKEAKVTARKPAKPDAD
jgi:hypothetical protein